MPRKLKFAALPVVALAVWGLGALPGNAIAAATTYVDEDSANNVAPCTQANPCREIGVALNNTDNSGTVFVDGGTYGAPTESTVVLGNGKSLIYQENGVHGVPDAPAIIDGGGGSAIHIDSGTTAGTIQGFTLRGAAGAVYAQGDVTITGNTFDDDTDPAVFASLLLAGPGNFTATNNDFNDPTPSDDQYAIRAGAGGGGDTQNSTISGNDINGFRKGIELTGNTNGNMLVTDNTITGTHSLVNPLPGIGIWVEDVSATLTRNLIHQPGAIPDGSIGITVFPSIPGTTSVHVTMARNQVYNQTLGVDLTNTSTATLNSDVSANNSETGLRNAQGDPSTPGLGDTTARNVTLWGNPVEDISIDSVELTLTSSIVQDSISASNSSGDPGEDPSCIITASRGPLMHPSNNFGCDNFQTTAAPGFVDPTTGINNFHLTASSPMIDMGSTVAPPPGTLDVDGDPRVVAGVCNGTQRADIGADEFVPTCSPPPTFTPPPVITPTPTTAPPPAPQRVATKKKCKKKRANAKKCKRK